MRRVMSLWLPSWPIERRRRPSASRSAEPANQTENSPTVIVEWAGGRGLLAAVDSRLVDSIAPGMPLADARAIAPDIVALDADPEGDAAALRRLAHWCGRYSPWTATDGTDGIWLDLTGVAHLFGDEAGLAADLLARLRRQGLSARAAIADTPGAASALARAGREPRTIVPSGATKLALALLPVGALRLPLETIELMERLGLRRIGDLYKLPRPAMVSRFGLAAAERLDQALGRMPEPLSPLPPAPTRSSHRRFAEPIARPEDLACAIASLADALCRALAADGVGARRLALRFYRVDGVVLALEAGTAQASRDPRHLAHLFAQRLDRIEPDLGIEDMRLEALVVEPLGPRQASLDRAGAADRSQDALADLVDRLENRLGAGSVTRMRPCDSHIPERAVERVPAFAAGEGGTPWDPRRLRPVRLLARPEPIEAVAPIPDDPPVLFRWRRLVHRIRAADGPERILGEWWREHDAGEEDCGGSKPADKNLRDYYCVEDMDGRRFWLFRLGLHPTTRWFLHGVLA
ncbi:MAG TPA: DNA polymerase Y family protein [Stellaceae bacterium]|nr:DNA polymerase Y family protein [Stellaceae bacterium]